MTATNTRALALALAGAEQEHNNDNEKTQDRYQALTERLVDANDLDRLPPPEPLVAGIMDRNSACWLQGKPGHAKVFCRP